MSRWPDEMTQRFLQHEAERRFARIEAVVQQRRREHALNRPLPPPIVDRDPGDEDMDDEQFRETYEEG